MGKVILQIALANLRRFASCMAGCGVAASPKSHLLGLPPKSSRSTRDKAAKLEKIAGKAETRLKTINQGCRTAHSATKINKPMNKTRNTLSVGMCYGYLVLAAGDTFYSAQIITQPKDQLMLYTIALILIIAWLLGLVSSYTLGGFIHILLIVAIVLILVRLIQGRKL